MSSNGQLVLELESIEDVHLAGGVLRRICQQAGIAGRSQGDQPIWIWRYVLYRVDHIQVGDVVYEDAVLEGDDQTLPIEPYGEDRIEVRILNYFRVLLEVAHLELPWRGKADDGQQR